MTMRDSDIRFREYGGLPLRLAECLQRPKAAKPHEKIRRPICQPPTWLPDGVALGGFRAHIPAMSTIVQCNCGAEYRRTEEKFLVPHTGDAICTVYGATLESWCQSTHFPHTN